MEVSLKVGCLLLLSGSSCPYPRLILKENRSSADDDDDDIWNQTVAIENILAIMVKKRIPKVFGPYSEKLGILRQFTTVTQFHNFDGPARNGEDSCLGGGFEERTF